MAPSFDPRRDPRKLLSRRNNPGELGFKGGIEIVGVTATSASGARCESGQSVCGYRRERMSPNCEAKLNKTPESLPFAIGDNSSIHLGLQLKAPAPPAGPLFARI
jgi:hypothetical protein